MSGQAPRLRGGGTLGFTLAEVLITLGIIGVVSAITIPSLIANYQKKVAAAKLKKAYSVISQAIEHAEIDNGQMSEWSMNKPIYDQSLDIIWYKTNLEYILPYLDGAVMKYDIYPEILAYGNVDTIKNLAGNSISGPLARYFIVTKDGMFISIGHVNWIGIVPFFTVDINGKSGPNTWGKDIFSFQVANKNKLTGANFNNESYEQILNGSCSKNYSGKNDTCSTLILQDGWRIKYPW